MSEFIPVLIFFAAYFGLGTLWTRFVTVPVVTKEKRKNDPNWSMDREDALASLVFWPLFPVGAFFGLLGLFLGSLAGGSKS